MAVSVMSVESSIHDKIEIEYSINRSSFFRLEFVFCLLLTVDALVIVLSCLVSGVGYHLWMGVHVAEILPLCVVGSLASLIYTFRMNGSGYYEIQESAKPRLEVREILVCWFTTGLLLALIAFLLKIGATYSRGTFVVFYLLSPIALLGARKIVKTALAQAVDRGAIGGRDIVLIGEANETRLAELGDVQVMCRIAAAHIERGLGPRRAHQAEMGEELLGEIEIGRGEPRIGDIDDFGDGHGRSSGGDLIRSGEAGKRGGTGRALLKCLVVMDEGAK